jgi:ADP-ribose pyrophosphatase
MDLSWKKIARSLLYQTKHFQIFREPHAHGATGSEHPFLVLETNDWVQIIATDKTSVRHPEAKLLWVEQFRAGSESVTFELPGGAFEPHDVEALPAARRELLEETGARAQRWLYLGNLNPNPALFRNRLHTFLAFECAQDPSVTLGDGIEVLRPHCFPFRERYEFLLDNKCNHGLVAGALALLEGRLQAGDTRL